MTNRKMLSVRSFLMPPREKNSLWQSDSLATSNPTININRSLPISSDSLNCKHSHVITLVASWNNWSRKWRSRWTLRAPRLHRWGKYQCHLQRCCLTSHWLLTKKSKRTISRVSLTPGDNKISSVFRHCYRQHIRELLQTGKNTNDWLMSDPNWK